MAQDEVIARRYARALAEQARDDGDVEAVGRDLKLLADATDEKSDGGVSEFRNFLGSPVVPAADKLAMAQKVAGEAGVGKTASDFLSLLIQRGRVDLLSRISKAYTEMAGDMIGVLTAVVHTARPLSDDQSARLAAALKTAMGKEVRLHQSVEPGLLAGAKVTVEGRTFDGSVLGRLESLRHRLAAAGKDGAAMQQQSTAKGTDNG